MLLTYTRTSVILCIAACVLFPLINRGANIKVLLATVLALSVVAPSVVRLLPGSEQAIARVSTLTNLQEDGSFQGRLRFFRYSLTEALYEPLGLGLGSHGIASKAGTASRAGMGDSTGYVQTLRTFGWIGTFLVIVCLVRLWGASNRAMAFDGSDITVLFYRSWFASGMVVFYSGDWLFTATFFWVLAGYVVGKSNEESMGDLSAWDDEQEYGSDDAEAQQIGLVGALFHK
jgi:hypothetical protein